MVALSRATKVLGVLAIGIMRPLEMVRGGKAVHELYAVHLRGEPSDANKIPPPFVLATAAVREDVDASEIPRYL